MRKRKLRTFVLVFFFLFFLLLMDYPYLSRLYNTWISGDVIAVCQEIEDSSDCRMRLAKAMDYNRYLAGERAGTFQKWEKEARVLCLDQSSLAGWIRIPALELILPLFIGTGDQALMEGAGILEGTSLPVGGPGTHTCISAHRGLPDRTLFTNLDMLRDGDRIEVHTLGKTLCYEMTGNETVLPSETGPLKIKKGKDLLTLITCTPYGINTHRLYVHAKRVPEDTQQSDPGIFSASFPERLLSLVFWKMWWWVPATILLLFFLFLFVRRAS